MPDTGLVIVTAGANIAGGGPDWGTPAEITIDNNTYSGTSGSTIAASDYLAGTGLGFALDAGDTVNGIEVQVQSSLGSNGNLSAVYVTKDGSTPTDGGVAITPGDLIWGGPTYLWGTTWTPSEINASTFGALVTAYDDTSPWIWEVDCIKIRVTYTTGSPPPTPTYRLSAQRRGR